MKTIRIAGKGQRIEMQDAGIVQTKGNKKWIWLAVVDGMGGYLHGREAANAFVRIIKDVISAKGRKEFTISATHAVKKAQEYFERKMSKKSLTDNMGAAFATCLINAKRLDLLWSGDCRVYVLRGKVIIFKSLPHTWAFDSFRNGRITYEEALWSPQNLLTGSVNAKEGKTRIEHQSLELKSNDRIFICTDGFWEIFDEPELIDLLVHQKISNLRKIWKSEAVDNYLAYLVWIE